MNFEDITILVPTQDRDFLVKRSVAYYKKIKIKTIIVDSSVLSLNLKSDPLIAYIHMPGASYQAKMEVASKQANTAYVCIVADDDFIVPSGLYQGINFLNSNKDFSSVQGMYVRFTKYFSRLFILSAMYTGHQDCKLTEESSTERVIKSMEKYANPNMALYRREVIVQAMKIASLVDEVPVHELLINLVSRTMGKFNTIPYFWAARDTKRYTKYIDPLGENVPDAPEHLILKDSLPTKAIYDWKEYLDSKNGKKIKNGFSNFYDDYAKRSNVKEMKGTELFDFAFSKYDAGRAKRRQKESIHLKFLKYLRRYFIPNVLANILWYTYRYISTNYLYKKFYKPYIKGYPWSDYQAKKDWITIKETLIKKER